MKILIALDVSQHSARALEFVTRMRWPGGSRVIVLSVLRPAAGTIAAGPEAGAVAPDLIEEQQRELADLVARAEGTLREAGFSTEGRVLFGDPREALIETAESEHADLLVVGSRGSTGIAKLMLGSVSSHLVTHAPCSVLVVKHAGHGAGVRKGRVA